MKFNEKTTTIGELFDDPEARKIVTEMAPIIDGLPVKDLYRDLTFNKAAGFIRRYLGQESYNKLVERLYKLE